MPNDLQQFSGGEIYERLLQHIFAYHGLQLKPTPHSNFEALQNDGIDAIIINPVLYRGISLQVKLFHNTFKYGTFPWEVSRFLAGEGRHVPEPHAAHFHAILDPQSVADGTTNIQMLLFRTTSELIKHFAAVWEDVLSTHGAPPQNRELTEAEKNVWIQEGRSEPCFKLIDNKDIYQLKLPHTAYQRNIRCRWVQAIPKRFISTYMLPTTIISNSKKVFEMGKKEFASYQQVNTYANTLQEYLKQYIKPFN